MSEVIERKPLLLSRKPDDYLVILVPEPGLIQTRNFIVWQGLSQGLAKIFYLDEFLIRKMIKYAVSNNCEVSVVSYTKDLAETRANLANKMLGRFVLDIEISFSARKLIN